MDAFATSLSTFYLLSAIVEVARLKWIEDDQNYNERRTWKACFITNDNQPNHDLLSLLVRCWNIFGKSYAFETRCPHSVGKFFYPYEELKIPTTVSNTNIRVFPDMFREVRRWQLGDIGRRSNKMSSWQVAGDDRCSKRLCSLLRRSKTIFSS